MASAEDGIVEILEIIEKMEKIGLDEESIMDKMKAKLSQAAKTTSWKPGQAFSILSEAKTEDKRKRRVLVDFYAEAKDFLDTINQQLLNLLQKHEGNVEENMTNHTAQLEQKEYCFLVAGRLVKSK